MRRMRIACSTLATLALLFCAPNPAEAQIFPAPTIAPNPLIFPVTRVGQASSPQTLTITATGAGTLPLSIFGVRLGDTETFSIASDTCSKKTLAPGQSCQVGIVFAPLSSGHYSTSFTLLSLSQEIITSSLLEGIGVAPAVTLSTPSIDFGDQTVGKQSAEHLVTLVNSGTDALAISSIAVSANFLEDDDCPESLAPRASCTIGVAFLPPSAASFAGNITITDDAADSPQTVSMSGKGIVPGQPDVSLSTQALSFEDQAVGTTSPAQRVVLTNTGTVSLGIDAITPSANFSAIDDCGTTLAPDGTCAIDVTFTPPSTGDASGTLLLDNNATDSPQTVMLAGEGVQGSGVQVAISPTSLDFGEVPLDTASAPQSITLTNSGSEPLVVDDVSIGVDSTESFSFTDTCAGMTVGPGEACVIMVTFRPAEKGTLGATINVTDNAAGSPQIVVVTGIGVRSSGGCSLIR